MPMFSLTSTWLIPASIDTVWACLIDTDTWPLWWKYVVGVKQLAAGEASGQNNIRQYHWRTNLPYGLCFNLRVIGIHPKQFIMVEVSGDLQGEGRCRLAYQNDIKQTQVVFLWQVKTCKPWMDWFAVFATPVFRWNHSRVMLQGEQALIHYLSNRNLTFKSVDCREQ